jgi:hypothetical protein
MTKQTRGQILSRAKQGGGWCLKHLVLPLLVSLATQMLKDDVLHWLQ